MKKIGGNTQLVLKQKVTTKNDIGEPISTWDDYKTIIGYLDFSNEATGRTSFNSKIEESSHVFICDYVEIDRSERDLKAYCNGKEFDITYIDDPMGLHYHLEIFLDYVGD